MGVRSRRVQDSFLSGNWVTENKTSTLSASATHSRRCRTKSPPETRGRPGTRFMVEGERPKADHVGFLGMRRECRRESKAGQHSDRFQMLNLYKYLTAAHSSLRIQMPVQTNRASTVSNPLNPGNSTIYDNAKSLYNRCHVSSLNWTTVGCCLYKQKRADKAISIP